MTTDLLNSVYNQLKSAVSATTKTNVFYVTLPNEDILKEFSVVYNVTNPTNTDSFNQKEAIKNYSLNIQVNNPTTDQIVSNLVFIKQKVYQIPNVNGSVKNVNLLDQDMLHDFDLKTFTGYLKFNLQYTV